MYEDDICITLHIFSKVLDTELHIILMYQNIANDVVPVDATKSSINDKLEL